MTMTRDPDLDQAIDQLRYDARRIRQLQAQVAQTDEFKEYRQLAARQNELADLTEAFATRAEKLRIDPDRRIAGRSLLLMVEEASRWRDRYRRRPSFDQLERAMLDADRLSKVAATEAAAEAALAIYARKVATQNAAATSAAVAYMEASR